LSLPVIFITAFFIAFSGAVVPGPLLTVTIVETTRKGILAGPLLIVGHGLLEVMMVIGLMFGLGEVLTSEMAGAVLSIIGGAVLFWMGWGIVSGTLKGKFSVTADVSGEPTARGKSAFSLTILGMVISVANPYWTLWWITFGAGFLQKTWLYGWMGAFTFFTGHILADFTWYVVVSVLVVTGQRFLASKAYRYLLILSGIFLNVMALYFIYSGIFTVNWRGGF